MKLLLTGASGFIGSKVLEEIQNLYPDAELVLLSHSANSHYDSDRITVLDSRGYEFDVDYLGDNGVDADVIVHMGAFIPKVGNETNSITGATSNIRCTAKLLQSAERFTRLRKIVFISTVDVYSETEESISENH